MQSIQTSALKCNYALEIQVAIQRVLASSKLSRGCVVDDAEYRVQDIGPDIGDMTSTDVDAALARGESFFDSSFSRSGPHLVLVKRTGEYFLVEDALSITSAPKVYLSDEHARLRLQIINQG